MFKQAKVFKVVVVEDAKDIAAARAREGELKKRRGEGDSWRGRGEREEGEDEGEEDEGEGEEIHGWERKKIEEGKKERT